MAAEVDTASARESRQRRARGWGRRHWLVVCFCLLAVAFVRGVLVEPVRVSGESMFPTLRGGDVVLVERMGPALGRDDIRRGDIVEFTSPEDGKRTIKRVMGVAGDSVAIRDSVFELEGVPVEEPYVDHESIDALYTPRVVVPDGHVYLLGDRRANSIDSRVYGPVPLSAVDGTVVMRLWAPGGSG